MEHKCGCNENNEHASNEHECCGGSHDHSEDHECGCGCHDHEDEVQKIFITLNSGEELECSILGTFNLEDKEYIALLPDGSEEVFLYKFKLVDDEPELALIESDDEYKQVSEVFLSLCDMDEE